MSEAFLKASKCLKFWFVLHFAIDWIVAIPLFVVPEKILHFIGFSKVDPVASRIVASALFAIGGLSLIMRNLSRESYQAMLNLKIIWSFFASAGILISIVNNEQGRPPVLWALLGIFIAFHVVWVFWRIRTAGGDP